MQYIELDQPPVVGQKEKWMCWAAVLESWLKVTKRGYRTQQQLAERLEALNRGDRAELGGAPVHSCYPEESLKLLNDPITSLRMDLVKRATIADISDYYRLIHDRGHLLVIYTTSGGSGHANLIYGVNPGSNYVTVMNPAHGGTYDNRSPSDLKPPLWIGFREYSLVTL